MQHLIDAILQDPGAALLGRSAAADELVARGVEALPLIQHVLDGNWKSEAHPKDVVEAFMYLAQRIHGRA